MISPQEKRFQDVEKLSLTVASKMDVLENKLNDYDSIKSSLNSLSQNLSLALDKIIQQDKQIKENLGLADKNHGFLLGLINDIQRYLEATKKGDEKSASYFSVIDSTLARLSQKIEFIDKKTSTLCLKYDLEQHKSDVENMIREFDEKIASAKRESASNLHAINESLYKHVSFVETSLNSTFEKSNSKLGQRIDDFSESVQQRLLNIKSQPTPCIDQELKDALGQVREMKIDLANILTSVKQLADHIHPVNDYSEKFKTLENSIASIFTMLKKYERG